MSTYLLISGAGGHEGAPQEEHMTGAPVLWNPSVNLGRNTYAKTRPITIPNISTTIGFFAYGIRITASLSIYFN